MNINVNDIHFGHTTIDLTIWQRIRLALQGHIELFKHRKEGWTGEISFYVFKCKQHGFAVDYVHGHRHREYFLCPKCVETTK